MLPSTLALPSMSSFSEGEAWLIPTFPTLSIRIASVGAPTAADVANTKSSPSVSFVPAIIPCTDAVAPATSK